jgi:hypothetical protein
MKKHSQFLALTALLLIVAAGFTGCRKKYQIQVPTNNICFGLEAGSQPFDLKANCEWTITKNDDVDWYTISPMSGKNDAILVITVEALEDADFREASFVINSPGGHESHTIFISQNRVDFEGFYNKVFGVSSVEHWNTDFYDQMIEDTYEHYEFNPYDTTTGYTMYFLADGTGVQMDHHKDTAVYYAFNYEYNPDGQILHIEFETVEDAPENYAPQVLTASDSLFRFIHEYKDHWWERADMRKIGTIIPSERAFLKSVAIKRKGDEPIFQF